MAAFWQHAKTKMKEFELEVVTGQSDGSSLQPPAWSLSGPGAEEATSAIASGQRTIITSIEGEDNPAVNDMTILCDPAGEPVALLSTIAVELVPFGRVNEDLARADGAVSLEAWRAQVAADYRAANSADIAADQGIIVETVKVVFP